MRIIRFFLTITLICSIHITKGYGQEVTDLQEAAIYIDKTLNFVEHGNGVTTVTATLTNNKNSAFGPVSMRIAFVGGNAELTSDCESVIYNSIAPGETVTAGWTVKANAGSTKLFVFFDQNGTVTMERAGKATSGLVGWVSGDSHNHTTYSDGSGTIEQNFMQAQKQGIDYVTITDHSNSKGWDEALVAGPQYGIIPIRGNEYNSPTCYAHALFINVNQEKNYSTQEPPNAVPTLKNDTNGKGLVYVAHPFDDGTNHWQNVNGWQTPIDGIEVWNSWYSGRYIVNARAFQIWDELNKQGRRLFGIATSDTHSPRYIGEGYTTVFVEEYTVEGILNGHRAGHMYGSNGPVVDFRTGSAMMGDTVGVSKDGETVILEISGAYCLPLSKIQLVKNGEVVYSKEINTNSFTENVEMFVKPGDFIRMEVDGTETDTRKSDGPSFDTSAPFAFTNPLFFIESGRIQ